jgi:hypothetical protein
MVLPILLFTELILSLTAWRATIMDRVNPILSAKISTIENVRILFRKAFLMPLVTEFTKNPFY